MTTGPITKKAVDAQPPPSKDSFLWDSEVKGFGMKLTPAGGRTYIYQYRLGGRGAKVRRYTIGAHGTWAPDSARKEARRLAHMVDQGVDPAADKAEKRRMTVELAFPAYAERFIEEYLRIEWPGAFDLASGLLRREAIPAFRNKTVPNVSRSDIAALMDRMASRPAARRNTFAVVRRLFRWAVNRGDIDVSPMTDMEAPTGTASRDRVLDDWELAYVWAAAEKQGYPFGPFTQLLIITGQRREEVSQLQWSELNRSRALWTLPSHRAKNGQTHDVPLSVGAIRILDGIAQRNVSRAGRAWPNRGFVFTATGEKGVTGYSVAKRTLDKIVNQLLAEDESVAGWRYHDLRRTLATGLQRLDVRFEVTEAVLNHVSGSKGSIAGVYQRHNWAAEKRIALRKWNIHVWRTLRKFNTTR
ncbi:integrase family protein [Sphingobium chlorophenolicum L-1]|uniref:Integrase family protein n=1 Tax=Sphingobium chlorophenolicum L-1 TaxID=690566 RepID=F6EZQ9_SPHCR|nr:tyrosine-type recombinase/integrase [Sphingobium chlorophenolicum]AEG50243.1 integrase family protein [Sphingobium chlorophenolicum L-1]